MKKDTPTFTQLMDAFGYRYELRTVFNDFLTMSMCAVTRNRADGKSHYEDLYMDTIKPYAQDALRHNFPKAFAQLTVEMEKGIDRSEGGDVLGRFYEHHFCRKNNKGQFFTPWPVCQFMAMCAIGEGDHDRPQRVLDPACGSGRTLLAAGKVLGPGHKYYGIDLDHTCVKMTALNLFLNGLFGSEVMCADALNPASFTISYEISYRPLGIFRVEEREESKLWRMYAATFEEMAKPEPPSFNVVKTTGKAQQLTLF